MAKTIKIEVDAEGIREIVSEWMGEHVSKTEAERILSKIKKPAEEELSQKAFGIISRLIERL